MITSLKTLRAIVRDRLAYDVGALSPAEFEALRASVRRQKAAAFDRNGLAGLLLYSHGNHYPVKLATGYYVVLDRGTVYAFAE